jgi:hypothetical protein
MRCSETVRWESAGYYRIRLEAVSTPPKEWRRCMGACAINEGVHKVKGIVGLNLVKRHSVLIVVIIDRVGET